MFIVKMYSGMLYIQEYFGYARLRGLFNHGGREKRMRRPVSNGMVMPASTSIASADVRRSCHCPIYKFAAIITP